MVSIRNLYEQETTTIEKFRAEWSQLENLDTSTTQKFRFAKKQENDYFQRFRDFPLDHRIDLHSYFADKPNQAQEEAKAFLLSRIKELKEEDIQVMNLGAFVLHGEGTANISDEILESFFGQTGLYAFEILGIDPKEHFNSYKKTLELNELKASLTNCINRNERIDKD